MHREPPNPVPPSSSTGPADVRVVPRLPSPLALYVRAALTARKPARAQPMPPLVFERHNVPLVTGDIARYAALTGFTPAHGVPPTWPHLLAFGLHMLLMTDRRFPFAMLGMVHLANHNRQFARLQPGDRLDLRVQCGAVWAHDKGQVFTVLTTAHRDGQPVWMGESLYLRTGVRQPLGAPYQSELRADDTLVQTETLPLPANLGRQYARISGDWNPIHLWGATARLFGFPRAIIHGMWSFARALAAVLPADAPSNLDMRVEFKTPLLLPGQTTLYRTPPQAGIAQPLTPDTQGRFELRDAAGVTPHLRARWQSAAPDASAPAIAQAASAPTTSRDADTSSALRATPRPSPSRDS